jgi:hypothetical protein
MTAAKEVPTVHQALAAVMAEVGAIGKDRDNDQQRFKFRGIDDVQNALHGPLAKHGVLIVPSVLERIAETRQTANQKSMNVVHLHVAFSLHGPAGDELTGSAWGEAQDSGDKATGKAHSMALKTFLLETFMVPTKDLEDADQQAEAAAPARRAEAPPGSIENGVPTLDAIDAVEDLGGARALVTAAGQSFKDALKELVGGQDGLLKLWNTEDVGKWAPALLEARKQVTEGGEEGGEAA